MRKITHFIAVALVTLLTLTICLPTLAQTNEPGSGLSISPLHHQLTLEPGKADKIDLTLKNITAGAIVAKAFVNDFRSDNNTGNPVIITDQSKKLTTSIRDFVIDLEDVPLAVGEQKKITIALQAPQKIPPGAYFGIIRFQAIPAGGNSPADGNVSLSASVGAIVLITVPGNIRDQVQLNGIRVYEGNSSGTLFLSKPTQAGVEVKNLGNGFAQPFGTIEVHNTFGKKVHSYQLNNTNPRGSILPDSTRIFRNDLKGISQPGRYTITASVAYGGGSNVIVGKKTFWYIPLWMAIIILLVLVGLVMLAYRLSRTRNRGPKRARRRG